MTYIQLSWLYQSFLNHKIVSLLFRLSLYLLFLGIITLITGCSPTDEPYSEEISEKNRKVPIGLVTEKKLTPQNQANARTQKLKYGVPNPYLGELSSLSKLNIRDARLDKVLTGLTKPWSFEFINQNELIITEISGKLSHFDLEKGNLTYISGLPEIATDRVQTGLLDVEIHPDFEKNNRIYFSYTASDEETGKYYRLVIVTAILSGDELLDLQQITVPGPFGWAPSMFGGALEFDGDGYLYIALGDRAEGELSQLGGRIEGKILRLHDDGSVPEDNPFIGNNKVDNRIYALGVRNPQGLHFDKESGMLFEAEHGPMGGDEVNIIVAGANYGSPTIGYGSNYHTLKRVGQTHKAGLEQPIFYYLPSVATSPITLYRGAMFHDWSGDLLVGALGGHISKLDLDDTIIRSEYPFLNEIKGRIRDVKVAIDGSIFILSEDGTLYRLYRDPSLNKEIVSAGKSFVYQMACAGCHDIGANNAPRLAIKNEWREIIEQPISLTYKRVIKGYNLMPERGLCNICTDEQLMATVDYMLEQVKDSK